MAQRSIEEQVQDTINRIAASRYGGIPVDGDGLLDFAAFVEAKFGNYKSGPHKKLGLEHADNFAGQVIGEPVDRDGSYRRRQRYLAMIEARSNQ